MKAKKETARRPTMKVPETFNGTHSKLCSWWEPAKDYMEIYEPTMPTDSVKIKFVGSLLREEARLRADPAASTVLPLHSYAALPTRVKLR